MRASGGRGEAPIDQVVAIAQLFEASVGARGAYPSVEGRETGAIIAPAAGRRVREQRARTCFQLRLKNQPARVMVITWGGWRPVAHFDPMMNRLMPNSTQCLAESRTLNRVWVQA